MPTAPLLLDGCSFSLAHAERVLGGGAFPVRLTKPATAAVDRASAQVQAELRSGAALYGINTGFGKLSRVRIDDRDLAALQENLLLSHASGVGEPLPREIARLALVLRANTLARGNSGVRRETIRLLLDLFEAGVAPVIPCQGSVGASGDLAPLAHLALLLIGRGEGWLGKRRLSGRRILSTLGKTPLVLAPKEGLALINGTQISTAIAVSGVIAGERLARTAEVAAALTIEALRGTDKAFDARIHALRGQPGQIAVAANLRRLLKGSAILPSHADCSKVQDPYSLRCAPQVHGAARDALAFARGVLEREMNAVTDNPLLFPADGAILNGGNFHAEPVAMCADFAAIAVAELANISERRIENMVNPDLSGGLPAFLAPAAGLNSGFMIAQVAAAALVSENKTLAHPASVDSIPTSAGKEDHVSMATWAARKLCQVVANAEHVIAIELLSAAQALDLYDRWLEPGKGAAAAYRRLRRAIPAMLEDRELAPDIAAARALVASGALLEAAEGAAGALE